MLHPPNRSRTKFHLGGPRELRSLMLLCHASSVIREVLPMDGLFSLQVVHVINYYYISSTRHNFCLSKVSCCNFCLHDVHNSNKLQQEKHFDKFHILSKDSKGFFDIPCRKGFEGMLYILEHKY